MNVYHRTDLNVCHGTDLNVCHGTNAAAYCTSSCCDCVTENDLREVICTPCHAATQLMCLLEVIVRHDNGVANLIDPMLMT